MTATSTGDTNLLFSVLQTRSYTTLLHEYRIRPTKGAELITGVFRWYKVYIFLFFTSYL